MPHRETQTNPKEAVEQAAEEAVVKAPTSSTRSVAQMFRDAKIGGLAGAGAAMDAVLNQKASGLAGQAVHIGRKMLGGKNLTKAATVAGFVGAVAGALYAARYGTGLSNSPATNDDATARTAVIHAVERGNIAAQNGEPIPKRSAHVAPAVTPPDQDVTLETKQTFGKGVT